MRTFLPSASDEVKRLLAQLAEPGDRVGPEAYRSAMGGLGEAFATAYRDRLTGVGRLLLICTNEDADFLARGVLRGLDAIGGVAVRVACFWNERESIAGPTSGVRVEVAPIVRRYVEPGEVDAFLVVKSIISSSCVVRTNITELVYEHDPARVLVFAPVVLKGADAKLSQEFEPAVASRFEFLWYAEDDEKRGDDVVPGIGGQVYERLGLGTQKDKNRYTPELVRERRRLPV